MQDKGEGLQPIVFLSRRLKPTEQRYSAYECELAVVAYCLQSWRHYLEGCPSGVTIVTDHQPLTRLMEQQVLTRVQTRWMRLGLFQSINPTIKYQPGKANIVADALSRSQRPSPGTMEARGQRAEEARAVAREEEDPTIFTLTGTSGALPPSEREKWTQAYQEDPKLRAAIQELRRGQPYSDYLLTPEGLLKKKAGAETKIVVPISLRQDVLRECHDIPVAGHIGI